MPFSAPAAWREAGRLVAAEIAARVEDMRGNAEALLQMKDGGLKISFK